VGQLLSQIKNLSAKTCMVAATEEAQNMGNPILANMILIGTLAQSALLPIEESSIEKGIKQMFPKDVVVNTKALKKGMELAGHQAG
jgi:indolepyruvate ferredoxin oxidoreductase beta subunit